MTCTLNHIHLKSPEPDATVKWYVDNLGARVVASNPAGGYRIDLHGLPINISGFVETQAHKQAYGLEHIALNTDDLTGLIEKLQASGAKVLEKISGRGGREVFFVEGPQGVILELVKVSTTAR